MVHFLSWKFLYHFLRISFKTFIPNFKSPLCYIQSSNRFTSNCNIASFKNCHLKKLLICSRSPHLTNESQFWHLQRNCLEPTFILDCGIKISREFRCPKGKIMVQFILSILRTIHTICRSVLS